MIDYTKLQQEAKKNPGFKKLCQMLLHEGGNKIVPAPDPHIKEILKRSYILPRNRARLVKGLDSCCHENAAVLWLANMGQSMIGTGYGLTDDGLWRQHSWLLDLSTNRIIETTEKRELYCGMYLEFEEAVKFAASNCKSYSWQNYANILTPKQISFIKGIPFGYIGE